MVGGVWWLCGRGWDLQSHYTLAFAQVWPSDMLAVTWGTGPLDFVLLAVIAEPSRVFFVSIFGYRSVPVK